MFDWNSVEIFVTVVNEHSFSGAAKKLGISTSHASRKISQLESRLGTQLLKRTTRRLSLSETGQAYYERCRHILNQMEDADRAVTDLQVTPRGTLRITVAGAFAERYVAPAAAEFMQQHKNLKIDLYFTSRTVDLVEEGYDLAIRAGKLKESSLVTKKIGNRQVVICCSRDYLSQYGEPQSIQDLKKHHCLKGSIPTWRLRKRNGAHIDLKVEGPWYSNNGYALRHAATKGLGLVQLPEFYVYKDIKMGRLLTVLEDYNPTDTAVWAVYPNNLHLSPKVRLFVEYLSEKFKPINYI